MSARAHAAMGSTGAAIVAALLQACAIGSDPRVTPGEDVRVIPLPDGGVMCRGNNDGTITRDEVVFAPGIEVRYRTNPAGTAAVVNSRGEGLPDGTRTWDFTDGTGDLLSLAATEVTDQWYAAFFAGAGYAAPLDLRQPTLGVYRATDTEVQLMGVVDPMEETGTRVRYEPAVPVLRFPMSMGTTWSADATVADGMVNNLPVASRDHYDFTVDAQGEVRLGVLTFRRALRLRLETTQRFPAGPGVRRIQYLWLAECYGEVARMTSRDGEVDPDFTEAADFRRLGL